MGVEDADIIFMNDFRWSSTIFLQALEGGLVHFPAPTNVRKQDIELVIDTPFFATADAPIVFVREERSTKPILT